MIARIRHAIRATQHYTHAAVELMAIVGASPAVGACYPASEWPAAVEITVSTCCPIDRRDPCIFMAHGPDGHMALLRRSTADAARRDGLAYFLDTRSVDANGRWAVRS